MLHTHCSFVVCSLECCKGVLTVHTLTPSHPHTLTGDRMDGYQKKKYISKLIFIFLLGNDIDFGHQEAVNLLSSVHFSEKQIVRQLFFTNFPRYYVSLFQLFLRKFSHIVTSLSFFYTTFPHFWCFKKHFPSLSPRVTCLCQF